MVCRLFRSRRRGTGTIPPPPPPPPPPGSNSLPMGVMSGGSVIGLGPGNNSNLPKWSLIQYPPTSASISGDIDTAESAGILLVCLLSGNKDGWRDVNGNFQMSLFISKLRRFRQPSVSAALEAKIENSISSKRIVCYVVDEPYLNNEFTPTQVNQMCGEVKNIWPDCITVVRSTPEKLLGWNGDGIPVGGYDRMDYAWCQWTNINGKSGDTYGQYLQGQRGIIAANNLNCGIFAGCNLWAGGLFSNREGVSACWDYNNDGSSSGYRIGDRDPGTPNPIVCGGSLVGLKSLLVSPEWAAKCVAVAAAQPDIPGFAFWQHTTGTITSEYDFLYLRPDYVAAFDEALGAAAARSSWDGWRTPK